MHRLSGSGARRDSRGTHNNHHAKAELRSRLQPSQDKLLCDPATKGALSRQGPILQRRHKKAYPSPTATYGTRFGFVDLAEAKAADGARDRRRAA